MRVQVSRGRRVRLAADIRVPLSPVSVWGEMRGFAGFAAADPFHRRVIIEGGVPRTGAPITIVHRYAFITLRRTGRILRWEEGSGFTFSDLSRRGRGRSFPHVFMFDVRGDGHGGSIVRLRVRGRWTARWMPRGVVWLWNAWVMLLIRDRVGNHLLELAIWKKRSRQVARSPIARCE